MTASAQDTCDNPAHYTPTWIGYCCREWVMAYGYKSGRCGLCGETPTYLREGEPLHITHPRSDYLAR